LSGYIRLQRTSDTEEPREPARESEQSIGLLVVCASGSWRALLQCGTLDGVVYQLSRGARRLFAARDLLEKGCASSFESDRRCASTQTDEHRATRPRARVVRERHRASP